MITMILPRGASVFLGSCRRTDWRSKCLLLKPLTYMNESGRSAGEAVRFYKIDLQDIIVLYDEIDLVPGKLKAKMWWR